MFMFGTKAILLMKVHVSVKYPVKNFTQYRVGDADQRLLHSIFGLQICVSVESLEEEENFLRCSLFD